MRTPKWNNFVDGTPGQWIEFGNIIYLSVRQEKETSRINNYKVRYVATIHTKIRHELTEKFDKIEAGKVAVIAAAKKMLNRTQEDFSTYEEEAKRSEDETTVLPLRG